jgi:hypothetical protein
MKQRLTVQKNGVIGVETITPGCRHSAFARDVSFCIEWLANIGWTQLAGSTTNPAEALREFQALRRRHKTISYRLVAFNDIGRVRLPRSWRPYSW